MSKRIYYCYDHYYGEGHRIGDFCELCEFIDNGYDKDRFTLQDSLSYHKERCKENNNPKDM